MPGLFRRFVMVHHSATPDGRTFDWDAIRRFHTSYRIGAQAVSEADARAAQARGEIVTDPWADVGYHAGVERIGGNLEAVFGRPAHLRAAACPQDLMNERALHVCLVGNFDAAAPSREQLDVLVRRVVAPWCFTHRIEASDVIGHRERNPHKTCPGSLFDLTELRRLVALELMHQ